MLFYVQYPDKHVEIWNHDRWYYNFVLPGDKGYYPSKWSSAPIDGSNHTTSLRDELKKIYESQGVQLSFFDEVLKND